MDKIVRGKTSRPKNVTNRKSPFDVKLKDQKNLENKTYLKEQAEADPLVVLVYLFVTHIFFPLLAAVPDARVGHLHPHFLGKEALQRVSGVNPTVRVQNVLWYVFGMDAVDWVPDVLPRGHDQTERYQQDDRDGVMQPKHRRVDVYIVHLNKIF